VVASRPDREICRRSRLMPNESRGLKETQSNALAPSRQPVTLDESVQCNRREPQCTNPPVPGRNAVSPIAP